MTEEETKETLFNWALLDERIDCAARNPFIYLTGNPGTARAIIAARFLLADPSTGPALWVNVAGTTPSLHGDIADAWDTAVAAGRIRVHDLQLDDDDFGSLTDRLKKLLAAGRHTRVVIHHIDLLAAAEAHKVYTSLANHCRRLKVPVLGIGTMSHLGAEVDLSPGALTAMADIVLVTRLHLLPANRSLSISIVKPLPAHNSRFDKPLYYKLEAGQLRHDIPAETASTTNGHAERPRQHTSYKTRFTFMPELIYFSADQEKYIRNRVEQLNNQKPGIQFRLPSENYVSPLEYNRHFEEFKQGHHHWDLFIADVYRLRELVDANLIWPLDEFMPSEWRERFLPLALDQCTIDGRLVAVPHWINVGVMLYRTDLLARHKLEVPQSWDDLVHHSNAIMKGKSDFSGFLFQGAPSESLTINFLEFLWNNGGNIFDQPMQISVDSQKAEESLQFMVDLIHKHNVSPEITTSLSETESGRAFLSGKAAFLRGWPQILALNPRHRSLTSSQVGLASLPTRDGSGPGHSVIGGFCFVIPKTVENPDEIMEFCRNFYSENAIPDLAIRGWTCPPYLAAYENRDVIRHRPFYSRILELMEHGRARKNIPHYESISQIIQSEISDTLRGTKAPREALDNIANDLHNKVYRQVRELRLQRVIEHINQNLHDDLSRDRMAALCHLSPSYFSTLFAETMNRPFARYVNEKRIERARHLLETTELTIGEIAESVGFHDQGYFCNVFREETRMAPSRYRLDALAKVIHR